MPSVLFVCMGNICRSPTAEAVMRQMADAQHIQLRIDSAGTVGHHEGSPPDHRAIKAGAARGYDFSHIRSRKVSVGDFIDFDLILAADRDNLSDLRSICPSESLHKLKLILDYAQSEYSEIPDPYYGGSGGFSLVLDLIEDACEGIIASLR